MKNRIPFYLLLSFGAVFTFYFYGKVILSPDNYFFSNEGDAIKNYFTYSYHIKHDVSYTNFNGMNYPYGEHFLYTDCHPVLANLFKWLASCIPFFSTHSIGILNFLMILSIFTTFIVCYFLLMEFKLSKWFALLYSIGITLLAPQLNRLGGHFALSYSVAIPLSWLLLLRFESAENKTKLLLLFLNNLFWLFIHAYLGMIILSFLICQVIFHFILNQNRRKDMAHYIKSSFALILPILLFYVFATLSDTHTGRTNNPSGFFLYNAEPDDVFLPHQGPLSSLLDNLTGNNIDQEWEAWSYVGISTTLLFIFLVFLWLKNLFTKDKVQNLPHFFESKRLTSSLIASLLVLLFAMAFPFKQIPDLLDLLPILKQFRATGRFAWPFYFVATVFAATVLQEFYNRTQQKQKKTIVLSICLVVGSLNIIEGLPYHLSTSESIIKSNNLFKKEFLSVSFLTAIQKINPADFQAIITLPFYYQGSENFSRPKQEETIRASLCLAYHTGIPLVNAILTRSSIRESKKIVQLVSPDFYKKEIQNDLPGNKPFLIIRTKDSITPYENDILKKCSPIYTSEEISVYSLKKEDLFKNGSQAIYDQYKKNKPNLFKLSEFYITSASSFLYYNGFDNLKSSHPFRGKGGFEVAKRGKNTLVTFAPNTFGEGKKYHFSIWMYNGIPDALNNWFRFIINEYDAEKNVWHRSTYFPEESEVINGNWSLVEGVFEVKNAKNKIYFITLGKDDSEGPLFMDELLIRETQVDVYKLDTTGNNLFYNNHDVLLQ